MRQTRTLLLAAIAVSVCGVALATGEGVSSGPTRVTTDTVPAEGFGDVDVFDNGTFVIGWAGPFDVSGNTGWFRRFDASGTATGPPLKHVDSLSEGPVMAAHPNGGYYAAYTLSSDSVQRVYVDANDTVVNDWLIGLNGTTGEESLDMDVDAAGAPFYCWQRWIINDFVDSRVMAKVPPEGSFEFEVEQAQRGSGLNLTPSLAVESDGDFVVVWEHVPGNDTKGLYFIHMDDAGNPREARQMFYDGSSVEGKHPQVSALDDGRFVVAYEAGTDVFARIYDAAWNPAGAPFGPTAVDDLSREEIDVAMGPRGEIVVAYVGERAAGQFVRVQRFSPSGTPLGPAFDLAEGQRPAIAMNPQGDPVVVWRDTWTNGSDVFSATLCRSLLVESPAPVDACPGDTAVFSSPSTGLDPLSFQWAKDGAPITDSGVYSGTATDTLTVQVLGPDQAGVYANTVTDACSDPQQTESAGAALTVLPGAMAIEGLALSKESAELRFRWLNVANATSYTVFEDLDPQGPFATVTGSASDGTVGFTVPLASGTAFYLVAGESPACGTGPLR